MDRDQAENFLVANCDCDKKTLNSLSDAEIGKLVVQAQIANAALKGFTSEGYDYRVNPQTGQWERRPTQNLDAKGAADSNSPLEEPEEDEDDDAMEKVTAKRLEGRKTSLSPDRSKEGYTGNKRRPQSFSDLARSASPEVQNRLQQLEQIELREKEKLIDRLLVNVAPAQRQEHADLLINEPLEKLEHLVTLMPPKPTASELEQVAKPTRNRRQDSVQEESPLYLPSTIGPEIKREERRQVENEEFEPDDDSNLSPRQREMLNNATRIVEQERRELIDTIIDNANIADEDQEQRLRASFAKKSPDELRLLLPLTNRRDDRRAPNYLGAGGLINSIRPTNNSGFDSPESEVLPLPQTIHGRKDR